MHFTLCSIQAVMPAAVMLSGLKLLGVAFKQGDCRAQAQFQLHLHKLVDSEPEQKQAVSCFRIFNIQY